MRSEMANPMTPALLVVHIQLVSNGSYVIQVMNSIVPRVVSPDDYNGLRRLVASHCEIVCSEELNGIIICWLHEETEGCV